MVKVQQRGLGRGLSALISENYTQTAPGEAEAAATPAAGAPASNGVREMAVKSIIPGKYQPRVRFDEEQLQELATSIRQNGIMQPIIVRPVSLGQKSEKDIFEIVAGERRWRAASVAGLKSVPVIVRELTDKQTLELAIVENVQRSDLSPIEEANGYQKLIEEFGYTHEEVADTVGKSRSHITNLLRMLALPEEIRALLEEGKLAMGHARALLNCPNNIAIAKLVAEREYNVRKTEELVRKWDRDQFPQEWVPRRPKLTEPVKVKGPKDPDIIALEQTLSESLNLQVEINDRGPAGEIILSYYSLEQLDDILRRLGGGM